ncbi:hypothetical protein MNVI_42790 [Mycobacterium noviomagense]|uniref:Uncharacterized protein n=1 Tax=Mycobacterium noviomagense TaxID=459858 RepID=A0A7I7PK52_9MYCO|nr:hypothetical protein MNVI_42790 [Mycobacterium noviomagense]
MVAEFDEAAAEIADVYALSATVCLAAVGQQSDPHAHARSVVAVARFRQLIETSASCLDTCLDYSLTAYAMQRTSQGVKPS